MTNRAGAATRQRILEATRDLLAEGGLEAATVKAICERAGVLPGSFYNLFDSKEEAIFTIIREAITAVDPDPEGEGSDTLTGLVDSYVKFVTGRPDLARVYLMLAVTGSLTDPAMAKRVLRHHGARVERFRDAALHADPGLSRSEAERRMEGLLAALNGYALHFLLDPDFDFGSHAIQLLAE
ncbi:MAG TPA: TetR/AcrR family transcriptional regulator [Acidimicrobiia bacterium]